MKIGINAICIGTDIHATTNAKIGRHNLNLNLDNGYAAKEVIIKSENKDIATTTTLFRKYTQNPPLTTAIKLSRYKLLGNANTPPVNNSNWLLNDVKAINKNGAPATTAQNSEKIIAGTHIVIRFAFKLIKNPPFDLMLLLQLTLSPLSI